jgi:signal transduction histidine kinase
LRVSPVRQYLERALDVVSDVFVVFDRDFRLVYHNEANRAAMRAAGMDPDAAVGKPVLEAMPQLTGTVGHRESLRALRDRVPAEWEESYGPDVRLRGRAFPTDDGGIIVVATNTTGEWKALEQARAARDTAEHANRAKTDFLAAMSHELRTPLNAISGYTDLLLLGVRGPLSAQQEEDLRRIARNQAHLLNIISDILNFARIETGSVELDLAPVPARDLLTSIEPIVAPQLAQKQLDFVLEPCDSTLLIHADREKTEQVLLNLLSNAVKFTNPHGRIEIRVGGEKAVVRIAISDTGAGIPADKLDAVFEPFVQVHRALNHPTPGTGLGLAISRDLARRMNGDITVESEVGRGSTFTLVLPRHVAHTAHTARQSA